METSASSTSPMMGDVLVTGGCGFLGFYIVRRLLDDNECGNVFVLDRMTTNNRHEGARYIQGSITDEVTVRRLVLDEIRPRVIFHCAAPNFTKPSLNVGQNDHRTTIVDGTNVLISAARDCPETRAFVFTASVDMFANPPHQNIDETHPTWADVPHKAHPYGLGKAMAAQFVLSASDKDDSGYGAGKLKTVALAISPMYGIRDSQIVNVMLDTFVERGIPPVQIGDGENFTTMLSVENSALAHVLAAKAMLDPSRAKGKVAGEVFIVTDGQPILMWHHLRLIFKAALGDEALKGTWHIPAWVFRAVVAAMDCVQLLTFGLFKVPASLTRTSLAYMTASQTQNSRKITETLGYKPVVDHDAIVTEAIRWEMKRRSELKHQSV